MRFPTRFLVMLMVLFVIAGCGSSDEGATDEMTAAAATTSTTAPTTTTPTTTTAAPTTTATTEAASTTAAAPTTAAEGLVVDEALATEFVAGVRDDWARAERAAGGTAPDLSDEEIVAVGAAMCEYITANPWMLDMNPRDPAETLSAFSEVAAVAAEALSINYDPTMYDAGFDNGFDARLVMAFGGVARLAHKRGALCPASQGLLLFHSPWSAKASE